MFIITLKTIIRMSLYYHDVHRSVVVVIIVIRKRNDKLYTSGITCGGSTFLLVEVEAATKAKDGVQLAAHFLVRTAES
jgi:hypothetical protein